MYKAAVCVFSCLFTVSCQPSLPVIYDFDARCQSLGIIGVSSKTSRSARSMLSEQVVQLGGNTLLFGAEGANQFAEYRARADEWIVDYWSVGVKEAPGESAFWGVALNC